MRNCNTWILLLLCMNMVAGYHTKAEAHTNKPFVPSLIRGPYLQSASATSIVIRWRTDEPTDSRVRFGSLVTNLNNVVTDNALVTEHEVKLTGLAAKTRYFYSIGSSTAILQGGADNYFETTPLPGSQGKYRIAAFGDCGNNSVNQLNVRDQLGVYLGSNYLDAWILLGDNAYGMGTDPDYQSGFFNMYKDGFLKKSPLYPSPGNHDYADSPAKQNDHNMPYYDVFTMPQQGESGGVPSGTEAYYSFDYGNIHFLSLDSYGREDNATRLYDTLGKQVTWIKQDLAANKNKDWVVAYWHHPPYTKGSHNSDTEVELIKIRENFIRILERYGVDLILCGHSHDYERSKMMKGHYGLESSFDPVIHNLSTSTGRYDGSSESCPYIKSNAKNQGTVYVVAGSAGQLGGIQAGYPHNGMPASDATHGGVLLLEVEANRLDAKWIGADGEIRDKFTLEKNVGTKTTVELASGKNITLNASFIGAYHWSNGATTRSIVVSPFDDAEYIVKDEFECVSDTFMVKVGPALPIKLISFNGLASENNHVILNWVTAFETNSRRFIIERLLKERGFEEVARMDAAGNSTENRTYSWLDKPATGAADNEVYYRLKQIDHDGTYSYSRIIAVKLNSPVLPFEVKIFPNPLSGTTINIEVTTGRHVEGEAAVYSVGGSQIWNEKIFLDGKKQVVFPSKLSPGTYLFKLTTAEHQVTKTIVVR
jgi:hypothetical protein